MISEFATKLKAIRREIREEYTQPTSKPWIVGFSGGKDSTLLVHLVLECLLAIPPDERKRPVFILSNDTLVESPVFQAFVNRLLDHMAENIPALRVPVEVIKTKPEIEESFWVNLLGRGYPAPNRMFQWCTDRMKIRPTSKFIREQVSRSGEAIAFHMSKEEIVGAICWWRVVDAFQGLSEAVAQSSAGLEWKLAQNRIRFWQCCREYFVAIVYGASFQTFPVLTEPFGTEAVLDRRSEARCRQCKAELANEAGESFLGIHLVLLGSDVVGFNLGVRQVVHSPHSRQLLLELAPLLFLLFLVGFELLEVGLLSPDLLVEHIPLLKFFVQLLLLFGATAPAACK